MTEEARLTAVDFDGSGLGAKDWRTELDPPTVDCLLADLVMGFLASVLVAFEAVFLDTEDAEGVSDLLSAAEMED